jgi:hypothetical protein
MTSPDERGHRMAKFNVKLPDATYRTVGELAGWMDGTMADVIREAIAVFWWLAKEYRQGNRLLIRRDDEYAELLIPGLEHRSERLGDAGPAERPGAA